MITKGGAKQLMSADKAASEVQAFPKDVATELLFAVDELCNHREPSAHLFCTDLVGDVAKGVIEIQTPHNNIGYCCVVYVSDCKVALLAAHTAETKARLSKGLTDELKRRYVEVTS